MKLEYKNVEEEFKGLIKIILFIIKHILIAENVDLNNISLGSLFVNGFIFPRHNVLKLFQAS